MDQPIAAEMVAALDYPGLIQTPRRSEHLMGRLNRLGLFTDRLKMQFRSFLNEARSEYDFVLLYSAAAGLLFILLRLLMLRGLVAAEDLGCEHTSLMLPPKLTANPATGPRRIAVRPIIGSPAGKFSGSFTMAGWLRHGDSAT
jgi:hypothetical protein